MIINLKHESQDLLATEPREQFRLLTQLLSVGG